MLWKFNKIYNAGRLCTDHQRPVDYQLPPPPEAPVQSATGVSYTSTRPAASRRE